MAALLSPGAATAQSLGQLLDSEIPLDGGNGSPHGVRNRPRPELQAQPLQLGGVAVSATLDTTLGSTTNATGAQSGGHADQFAEWAPQVLAQIGATDQWVELALAYDGKRFLATPAKRQDGYSLGMSGHFGGGTGGVLTAEAFQQRRYEDQLAGSFPAQGGGAVAVDQSHAQARLAQASAHVKLTGAVAFDRLRYRDTVTSTGALLPQSQRDDDVLRASTRVDYALPGDSALFALLSWRHTAYVAGSLDAAQSSREWRGIAGLSADITALIRLSAGLGYYHREFHAGLVGPFPQRLANRDGYGAADGSAWDLRCVYAITEITTVSLRARREFVDANVRGSPGYQATSWHAQIDHEFLRNLLVSAALGVERDRFHLLERRDHLQDVALWADGWLSPHLLVRPRFEWLSRGSSGGDAGPHIREFRTQLTLSVRN